MSKDRRNNQGLESPSSVSEFSNRLRDLEGRFKNRSEIAKAIGVAKSSYQRWVEGQSTPSFEAMVKLAKVANVSLDWLAFGKGHSQLSSNQDIREHHGLDNFDWFGLVLEMLGDCYRFCGHNPPPNNYVHDAADIYMETATIKDHDERRRTIGIAVRLEARNIKPPETEIDKLHG